MDADHANRGRRTLEEIRQKRAVERQVAKPPEVDLLAFVNQIKELESRNADLERENQKLLHKVNETETERNLVLKRLNDLENTSLTALRKSLRDASLEKDAAVVAKEDALSELRTVKKKLKEAEEEQYRAEEDAATLRAELITLQQQTSAAPHGGVSITDPTEDIRALEKQVQDLQTQLQQESLLRQQEQSKLAEVQTHNSFLMAEKQELGARLEELAKKISEEVSEQAQHKDKERLGQLHDMALMVQRLEAGRQKLLSEIDSQSLEIERLFEENAVLAATYQDAVAVTAQWEKQVKDCLKQNEELRANLNAMRLELAGVQVSSTSMQGQLQNGDFSASDPPEIVAENHSLKGQLMNEKCRSEELAAQVLKLNAELSRRVLSLNDVARRYQTVFKHLQNNLMRIKEDDYATIERVLF